MPEDLFLQLDGVGALERVYLKIEGLNPAGSIKVKAARIMIARAEKEAGGDLAGRRIIESTSGNLGVALASICAAKGYALTCVTDPNVNATACAVMRSFGADVVMIDQRDANGGFLGSRVEFIAQQLLADPSLVWLDQYTNPGNSLAHEWGTARALLNSFPSIDYLFVGVGTGGTLAGCLATMRRLSPLTKVVAVDAIGSVTFGQSAAVRRIPGLGSSLGAVMVDRKAPDVVVHVSEADTIHECRWMASQKGILVGGSTGTVLAALRLMTDEISPAATVVAISPDLGDRYLDTIYDDGWILRHGLDRNSQEPATDQDRTRVTYRSERSLDAVI